MGWLLVLWSFRSDITLPLLISLRFVIHAGEFNIVGIKRIGRRRILFQFREQERRCEVTDEFVSVASIPICVGTKLT
jgi:hypothetical protein